MKQAGLFSKDKIPTRPYIDYDSCGWFVETDNFIAYCARQVIRVWLEEQRQCQDS